MDDRPRVALYSHVNAGHARKMSCFTSEVEILILLVKFFKGLNQTKHFQHDKILPVSIILICAFYPQLTSNFHFLWVKNCSN